MLYALEERNVYKKSIIDDELKSANMAIAKTAFAFVKGAVSYNTHLLSSSSSSSSAGACSRLRWTVLPVASQKTPNMGR